MSSLSILDVIYKITNYIFYEKKKKVINKDYELLVKIDNEFIEEKPNPNIINDNIYSHNNKHQFNKYYNKYINNDIYDETKFYI
jgi:hypothetical protein